MGDVALDADQLAAAGAAPTFLHRGQLVSFRNVTYEVDSSTQRKQRVKLLENLSGYLRPGELVALMGERGAGGLSRRCVRAGDVVVWASAVEQHAVRSLPNEAAAAAPQAPAALARPPCSTCWRGARLWAPPPARSCTAATSPPACTCAATRAMWSSLVRGRACCARFAEAARGASESMPSHACP